MWWNMQAPLSKILAIAVAVIVALGTMDVASARSKKHRAEPSTTTILEHDYDGTPIIMRGPDAPKPRSEPRSKTKVVPEEKVQPSERAERPRHVPRGSSTYIPPPVPSPYASPPPPLTQPPAVYQPPPINSFGDRVTNCIHSYPLNKGIGNNPTDQQMYIRQCAN
jgi:hypothetical protein